MEHVNKNAAMLTWLAGCPLIYDLFFNFSDGASGNTVVATNARSQPLRRYVDGGTLEAYDFTLIRLDKVSTVPNSAENASVMFSVEALMEWLRGRNAAGDFPDFGDENSVQSVELLQNVPTVAGWDDEGAKYQFACRVTYYHKKD